MAPKAEKKVKEAKDHNVNWEFEKVHPYHKDEQVFGKLSMPSAVTRYKLGKVCPRVPVMLDLLKEADQTIYALTIMRDSCGTNILKAKLVLKGKSGLLAWVEPYTGVLMNYLKSNDLGISEHMKPGTEFCISTPNFTSAVSQAVDGIEQLRISGQYHGDFTFENTYYSMSDTGELTVKLCNFKEKKGITYKQKIAEDWYALANGLAELRKIAVALKEDEFPHLDYSELDGLIAVLRNITPSDAESAYEIIKSHPFFWGKAERKEFFIADIPLALGKPDFFSKMKKANFIDSPWGHKWRGLLSEMNRYRARQQQDPYNTSDRVQYVKFISGLYSHEFELETPKDIDISVLDNDPGLCYCLYEVMHYGKTTSTKSRP